MLNVNRCISTAFISIALYTCAAFMSLHAAHATESSYAVMVIANFHPAEVAYVLDEFGYTIWVNQINPNGHEQHQCLCFDSDEDGIKECNYFLNWTMTPEESYYYTSAGCEFSDEQGNPPPDPPQYGLTEYYCHRTLVNPCQ
jgi:hypothetical protein